ncbi:hypothetical protein EKE94_14955 [Mesobaculum littorinae]|uniref:Uncharacterized protein n=1 Tax=Mesobaculum littorinae TaxID=2486419 RepID=A0A438AF45_9RHOB|nr:hypothetical protein [Mesobaculum littorinae]RVV97308.1 hypothetical protein EKE94_14955 [Mesobaculum littorinae]
MTYQHLGLGLILAASGAMASAETMTFSPADGTERTYRMVTSVRPGDPDDPDAYGDMQQVTTLSRMRALPGDDGDADGTGGDLTLRMRPLWLKALNGGDTFTTSDGIRGSLRQAMEAGFDATIDPATGRIEDVSASGDAEVPAGVFQGLKQQFAASFVPAPIELEEGWRTTLPLFAGTPAVSVTVTELTEDRVFLRYEGGDELARLAGVAVMDRDEGWTERAVFTTEIRTSPEDDAFRLRETTAIAPADYPGRVHADGSTRPPEWRDLSRVMSPILPLPTEDEVFPRDTGKLMDQSDGRILRVEHADLSGANIGRITIETPRLFGDDGALDVPLLTEVPFSHPGWEQDAPWVTDARLDVPVMNDIRRDFARATDVRAQVSWYPVAPFLMTLTPDGDGHGEVTRDGATARMIPTADGVELMLSGKPGDTFGWRLPEGVAAQGKIYAGDRGPDWLTPTESLARRLASPDQSAIRVVLRMDEVPDSVTVRVNRHATAPAATRRMRFLTERGRRLDPGTVPATRKLFRTAPPRPLSEVAPEGLDSAALYFRLEARQAAACTAHLDGIAPQGATDAPPMDETPPAEGQATAGAGAGAEAAPAGPRAAGTATDGAQSLVFAETPPEPGDPDGVRLLRLRSQDGTRTHFYELGTRQVTLSCDATIAWTAADVQPKADRPWLVDPAALDLSPDMTIGTLRQQVRFLDGAGDALALAAPDGRHLSLRDTVGRATFPDGTLHVAGRPAEILRAVSRPGPVTRSYTVTFPDLPVPQEAP